LFVICSLRALGFFHDDKVRPLRLPTLRLSAEVDMRKEHGEANYAGWAFVKNGREDLVVGNIGDNWVGALTVPYKEPRWWIRNQETTLSAPIFVGDDFLALEHFKLLFVRNHILFSSLP
jgi:hypothetical protein